MTARASYSTSPRPIVAIGLRLSRVTATSTWRFWTSGQGGQPPETQPLALRCTCVAAHSSCQSASHAAIRNRPVMCSVSAMRLFGREPRSPLNEQSSCSTAPSSHRQASETPAHPDRDVVGPNDPEIDTDQRLRWSARCGAPRRNRTGDPILTMNLALTAVRTSVCAGRW
jgi:hypothetical protein